MMQKLKIAIFLVMGLLFERSESKNLHAKSLKTYTAKDYKDRYGINIKLKKSNNLGKFEENENLQFMRNGKNSINRADEDLYLGVGGTTAQYPLFLDRVFLDGEWLSTDTGIKKQFNVFEKASGQFECAFFEDEKSNNFFIF